MEGEWDFGLERPGGGPGGRAMPGAGARQADKDGGCVMKGRDREGMWKGGGTHTERKGDDGSRGQRSDDGQPIFAKIR